MSPKHLSSFYHLNAVSTMGLNATKMQVGLASYFANFKLTTTGTRNNSCVILPSVWTLQTQVTRCRIRCSLIMYDTSNLLPLDGRVGLQAHFSHRRECYPCM